jgi:hypothetical protein
MSPEDYNFDLPDPDILSVAPDKPDLIAKLEAVRNELLLMRKCNSLEPVTVARLLLAAGFDENGYPIQSKHTVTN